MANDNNKKKYIKYEDTTYILEDSRIPDPSSADNGKVLGVVNGEYALKNEEGGSGAVTSVNGKTGAVVLDAEDVGALPDSTVIPTVPQMAVQTNMSDWATGKTVDAATLKECFTAEFEVHTALSSDIEDLQAEKYTKPSGGIPASDLAAGVIPTVPTADISANTAARHTHDNKALLDTYTQTESNLADAVTKKHTHSNKTVLDEIDATKVAAWDAKGTYSKPTGGIPASDMASAVQTSLGKADTALQSHQSLSGYATEQWVENKNYLTQHQSLAAYRTSAAQDTIDAGKLGISENAYRSASIPMGELDSTSTATVMTATVPGITELRDGVCMWLRNGVVTSASGFTININNLGAKPCYSSLAAESRSTTIFNANYTMLFVYNSTRVEGGCWDIVYGVDTNTTYTPVKLGFGYGTCTTAAATVAKTASISSYALTTGGIVSIKFDNDVPANATLNITSKGAKAIYHRGAAITAGVIKAGDTATFVYSTYYHLISIDRDEAGDTLPAVTASDNGKFLRVVSGVWAAATVPAAESNSF